ncbi:MAG: hypothetical protein A2X66_01750 [Ignavibacteria bacterium GWA2_54_16]|nr:MAG: hypothetical protein A2X66_01750 [Ignavibacteria bacterium GWA2_54_16]
MRFGSRTGGTRSGDKAVSYLVEQFRKAGFTPVVEKDPKRLAYELKNWSLKVQSPPSLRNLVRNEWVGAYSPSVPNTTASLVYLHQPENAPSIGLKNKALLIDAAVSNKTYRRLAEAGVLCLLLTSPNLEGAYSDWAMISDLPESEKNLIPLFNLSRNNGLRLKKVLMDSVEVILNFSVRSAIDSGSPKTVIATLKGESERYFLICAHGDSDSGGPGADDNASGVSAVLETARILQALVKNGRIPRPKFSLRFAIWGTEIYSTEHFVRRHADEVANIHGVLNLDEVGTGATRNCIYFESNDVGYNAHLLRTLEAVGEEFVGKRGYWSESTTNPSQGGTDSYVFFPRYLARLKLPELEIPAITIYTGAWNELKALQQTPGWSSKAWKGHPDTVYVDYSAYYHSSLDVPATTTEKEPFNMSGAVKALGIGLLRLAW